MKKIVLLIFLFISVIANGQEFRESKIFSPDGTLTAIKYDSLMLYQGMMLASNNTTLIKIIKDGKVIKEFNPLDVIGLCFGVKAVIFSGDSKKLYLGTCLKKYEYNIENDTFRKMFEDFEKPFSPYIIGVRGDTLLLRTTVPYHGDYWAGNEFYKYIDGKYIKYDRQTYWDYINGAVYLKGKKCVTSEDIEEYTKYVTLMGI